MDLSTFSDSDVSELDEVDADLKAGRYKDFDTMEEFIASLDDLEQKAAAKKGPGSRGGNFWIDARGRVRYGKKPTGRKPKAGGPKAPAISNDQRLAEHNADRARREAEHQADRARREAEHRAQEAQRMLDHAAAEQRRAESHAQVMEQRAKREATQEAERAAVAARREAESQQRMAIRAQREAERARAAADKAAADQKIADAANAARAQLQAAQSMGDITAAGFTAAGTASTPEEAVARAAQLRADHPDQLVAVLRVGGQIAIVTKPAGADAGGSGSGGGKKPKKNPKVGAGNEAGTSSPRGSRATAKEADSPLEVKGLEPSSRLARLERRYTVEVEDEIARVYDEVAGHYGGN